MRRRSLVVLAHAARTGALALTFTGALALGLVLHANTPASRRLVVRVGNQVLRPLFEGKIVARELTSLTLGPRTRLHVREAELASAEGKRIVVAREVDAELDLARLLGSLARTGVPDVQIEDVRIAEAEVVLDVASDGALEIARAFARPVRADDHGRTSSPGASAGGQAKKNPSFHLKSATLGHAHVHGNLAPPEVDADADDVHAQVDLVDEIVTVTLERTRVTLRSPRAPTQTTPAIGIANGKLVVDPRTTPTHLVGSIDFSGASGGIPVVAHAEIDGERVAANVDIARTDPAVLGAAFTASPLTKPLELHARAHGKLPTIQLDLRGRLGDADVTAKGEIDVREGNAFVLDLDASHFDAASLGLGVVTDLTARIHGDGTLGGVGAPRGSFRVATDEGTVSGERTPALQVEGRFEPRRVTAVVRGREPGVEVTGKIDVDLPDRTVSPPPPGTGSKPAPSVTFDLQARSTSLRAFARAPNVFDGAASARARGKIDLDHGTIQATTTLSADRVGAAGFSAKRLSASGVVSGPVASPLIVVGFAGTDVELRAKNKAPLVYPSATGHAKITLAGGVRITEAEIDVAQAGDAGSVTAFADRVSIVDGVVEARGLRIVGLGEPLELDTRIGDGTWNVRARGSNVDLRRLARATGIKELETFPSDTRASLDVDLRQTPSSAEGHLDVVVHSDGGLTGSGPLDLEVHATIERGKLVGNGKVSATGFGTIEMKRAELDLPARLDAPSLRRTTGIVELRGSVDLSQGAALFAGESVERVDGIASFEARIERGDPDALPAVRATVRTEGLEVALSGEPPSKTLLVSGVDLEAHGEWDGRTDDAELTLVSWDRHGVLGNVDAKVALPLAGWIGGAQKLDARSLSALDISAIAHVAARDVADLPPFLFSSTFRGRLGADLDVSGTIGHPNVVASVRLKNLREDRRKLGGASTFEPLDGTLDARWDGERATMTFALDERERQRRRRQEPRREGKAGTASRPPPPPPPPEAPKKLGHLRGLVLASDLRISDVLEGKPLAALPWTASAEIESENLGIDAIPLPGGLTGAVTGRLRIRDLNREPSFEAKAHVDGFGAGGVVVESLDLTTGGRDASLFAHVSIVDHSDDSGTQATLQLASKSLRLKGISGSWDPNGPTRLDYAIQNGKLALFTPLFKSVISELDGRVDGAGSVTIDETSQLFEGGLAVQSARLYLNALGEEISSVFATARFERSGTFRIDDATGKVGAGEFRASANGKLEGFKLVGGEATLVATKDGIPISSEGATFAEATGEMKLTAKMAPDGKTLALAIDVPRAIVEVPDRDTQALQDLDPDATILVGLRQRNGDLDTTAVRKSRGGSGKQGTALATNTSLTTRMDVVLGTDVRLQGRGLDVILSGRSLVELADELRVTGRIDARGGTIEVHGRRFVVDRGTVTFPEGGAPSNPTIVAAAYWDAPDRTRVWVEFTGPLKTGTLALRSEPPYSNNEILSVLLFGRPDPNIASASGQKTGASSGATAALGLGAADFNRALSQLDKDLDVETDTVGGNRTRVKVGRSFFDRRLKVQIAPTIGRTTYREPDTTYLFLNWQFVPKWSLVATAGDRGTSILDVLFQHRY